MLLYCPKEIILAHLKPADSGDAFGIGTSVTNVYHCLLLSYSHMQQNTSKQTIANASIHCERAFGIHVVSAC